MNRFFIFFQICLFLTFFSSRNVVFAQKSEENSDSFLKLVLKSDSNSAKDLSDFEICECAKKDASIYHGKELIHVFLGLGLGPFAAVGTLISQPNPKRGQLTYRGSENSHLFENKLYKKCYRKKVRSKLIGMEGLGAGLWLILVMVV